MFFSTFLRSSFVRFSLLAVMLASGIFISAQLTGRVEAAPPESTTLGNAIQSAEGTAEIKRFECQISQVAEWVHDVAAVLIVCSNSDGAISSFAEPISESNKRSSRILAIALTAVATGKSIFIDYDPANTDVHGCSAVNCRNIFEMGIRN